jgi:hypothetical protein
MFLTSASGFSLVEIMIGGGILAGVALASAQLFKDQKFAQKKIDHDQRLALYHQNLVKTMSRAANCNATLNQFIPVNSVIAPQDLTSLNVCTGGCVDTNAESDQSYDAYTPGAYVGTPLISPGDFTDDAQIWRVDRINILTGRNNTGNIVLRISYTLNPRIPNSRTVNRDIVLSTRFSGTSFRECLNDQESSINNLQNDLCKTLNLSEATIASNGLMAVWNDLTQTCELLGTPLAPIKDCSTLGLQVNGMGDDGVVRCKSILTGTEASTLQSTAIGTCVPPNKPQAVYNSGTQTLEITCVP